MEDHWILEKTTTGIDEVATRGRGLSRQQRALLIMSDGRTPVGTLCRTAAALGEAREVLASLLALGLVRPRKSNHDRQNDDRRAVHATSASPASARDAPAAASRPTRRRSVALARLYLLNVMEQALRHDDHPVRERLRAATSRTALIEAFAHCRAIAEELGVAHAQRIEANFMDLLPDEAGS